MAIIAGNPGKNAFPSRPAVSLRLALHVEVPLVGGVPHAAQNFGDSISDFPAMYEKSEIFRKIVLHFSIGSIYVHGN